MSDQYPPQPPWQPEQPPWQPQHPGQWPGQQPEPYATQQIPAGQYQSQPPPRPRWRKSHKVILSVIGGLALFLVLIAVVGSLASPSKPVAAKSPAPAATTAAPAATTSAAASTPAAASSTSMGPQVAILQWYGSGGQSSINAIVSDMTTIQQDANAGNISATGQDCAALGSDVAQAQAAAPIPYGPAEFHYKKALADFLAAAADCQVGTATVNASEIQQATAEMYKGNYQLGRTTAAIKGLTGN